MSSVCCRWPVHQNYIICPPNSNNESSLVGLSCQTQLCHLNIRPTAIATTSISSTSIGIGNGSSSATWAQDMRLEPRYLCFFFLPCFTVLTFIHRLLRTPPTTTAPTTTTNESSWLRVPNGSNCHILPLHRLHTGVGQDSPFAVPAFHSPAFHLPAAFSLAGRSLLMTNPHETIQSTKKMQQFVRFLSFISFLLSFFFAEWANLQLQLHQGSPFQQGQLGQRAHPKQHQQRLLHTVSAYLLTLSMSS